MLISSYRMMLYFSWLASLGVSSTTHMLSAVNGVVSFLRNARRLGALYYFIGSSSHYSLCPKSSNKCCSSHQYLSSISNLIKALHIVALVNIIIVFSRPRFVLSMTGIFSAVERCRRGKFDIFIAINIFAMIIIIIARDINRHGLAACFTKSIFWRPISWGVVMSLSIAMQPDAMSKWGRYLLWIKANCRCGFCLFGALKPAISLLVCYRNGHAGASDDANEMLL